MSISISVEMRRGLAACAMFGALTMVAANPAVAQKQEEPDVKNVAMTPLEDVGLMAQEIPEVLVIASRDPYLSTELSTCNAIVAEIAALDTGAG